MSTDTPTLLLSRSGIAALAGVRRPVVTMWAKRYRTGTDPFPSPAVRREGQDRFDGTQIVDWLVRHGLGNNDALAEELPIHAALDDGGSLDAQVAFDGITALLCVKKQADLQLSDLDEEDLLEEAQALDRDDTVLYSELTALGSALETVAEYVDRLADAAYSPRDAFEVLLTQRFRSAHMNQPPVMLSESGGALCASIASALTGGEHASFVDPVPGSSDLLVAVRAHLPEYADPTAVVVEGTSTRLARRRLLMHGWTLHSVSPGSDILAGDRAVVVMQYPSSRAHMSAQDVLTEIDDVTLQMGAEHTAVVLAPAHILVDRLRDGAASRVRSDILRSDRLRASIRLPEGLIPSAPGLPLALWVLGAAHESVPVAERRTVVADLSDVDVDAAAISAVVDDVVAAMGSPMSVRAHSFHFGELVRTSTLLANEDSAGLGARRKRPKLRVDGAEIAAQAGELVSVVNYAAAANVASVSLPVEYRSGGAARLRTVGDLVAEGVMRMVPGNRIDPEDIVLGGDHRLIGPDEVLGRRIIGARGIDRLTYVSYPHGRFTIAGDIIVCGDSEFGAVVDHEGAAVVPAPARVLRIVDPDAGLIPEVVAEYLRATKTRTRPHRGIRTGASWRSWEVPQLRADHAWAAKDAFDQLAARRRAALNLVDSIDALTTTVVDGLARGVLVVTDPRHFDRQDIEYREHSGKG